MASSTASPATLPSTNKAAYITAAKAHPLQVSNTPNPVTLPSQPNELLIRNHAVAMNPIDWKMQAWAHIPIAYPAILGNDIAGTVVAVHPDATHGFRPGDRVLACPHGFDTKKDEHKGFQEHTVVLAELTARLPSSMSFEEAVVLPMGIATAASGFFNPELLGLRFPTLLSAGQSSTDGKKEEKQKQEEVLLVSGGASAVGGNTIQLAAAAGYTVLATASPKNFDAVKKLGATAVFDYNRYPAAAANETPGEESNSELVTDILAAVPAGAVVVGAFDAVGKSGWHIAAEFMARAVEAGIVADRPGAEAGAGKVFVATASPDWSTPTPRNAELKAMYSLSIIRSDIARKVFNEFLEPALAQGQIKAWPEPLVFGHGLEKVQGALDLLKDGEVSGQKVVVTL
ncbi:chaperonin 10-like protein [Microdochium trichocladiopsis]|uniref:Chaperonin 10-like protein n=1 Tax=Microdochium trichocladiopsis TaxID=1682393 RepID=A0A9P8XTS7_9PEZI|nr:chaperonin 10-like protein [Microdochium trichocladiopsis]KAH7014209.1 chaperonin 10-like protein [Microdochium trichocladiopsis]